MIIMIMVIINHGDYVRAISWIKILKRSREWLSSDLGDDPQKDFEDGSQKFVFLTTRDFEDG